jgi:hypothetical protein
MGAPRTSFCQRGLATGLWKCNLPLRHGGGSVGFFTRSRKTRQVLRPLGLNCPGVLASTLVMAAVANTTY